MERGIVQPDWQMLQLCAGVSEAIEFKGIGHLHEQTAYNSL